MNEQTYPNIDHVFVDGASTDDTLDVIERECLVNKMVMSELDEGIYDALNKGINLATGDIIGFLHADDFFANSTVLSDIAAQFLHSEIDGVYGDLQYISQADPAKVIRNWNTDTFSYRQLRRGWTPPHPTLYIRKNWYERIGGFDTRYRISADYYSMLRLFGTADFNTAYLPKVLVKMRVGGASNRSLKNIIQKSREDLDALKRSGVGGVGTLFAKNFRKVGQFFV